MYLISRSGITQRPLCFLPAKHAATHAGEAVRVQLTAEEMPQGDFTPLILLGMDYNAILEKITLPTDRATLQHFLFGVSLSLIQAC